MVEPLGHYAPSDRLFALQGGLEADRGTGGTLSLADACVLSMVLHDIAREIEPVERRDAERRLDLPLPLPRHAQMRWLSEMVLSHTQRAGGILELTAAQAEALWQQLGSLAEDLRALQQRDAQALLEEARAASAAIATEDGGPRS